MGEVFVVSLHWCHQSSGGLTCSSLLLNWEAAMR